MAGCPMRRGGRMAIAALSFLCTVGTNCRRPAETPSNDAPAGWRLTWSDEFDGTRLDSTRWWPQVGNGFWSADSATYVTGWGNAEQQCYTGDTANVRVAAGVLSITARREVVRDMASRDAAARCAFTSARLVTRAPDGRALFAQRYGRFAFRARLPEGQGLWPALWLLPLTERYGTWAASGEIDVMEARGQVPTRVLGTLHYGARWPNNVHRGDSLDFPHGGRITDFHVYALEWEPGQIRWFVDDSLYQEQSAWWSSARADTGGSGATPKGPADHHPFPAPFDEPFYLVMNLAVGGNFLGSPDATTRFPATLQVDWVRIYAQGSTRLR